MVGLHSCCHTARLSECYPTLFQDSASALCFALASRPIRTLTRTPVAASGRKLLCGLSIVLEKWNGLRSWTSRILFVITQGSRRRHLAENRRKAALLGIGNILLLDPPGMILRPDAEFGKKTTSIGIPMLRFCSLEPVVLGFEQLPKQSPPQEHMRLPARQNPTPTQGRRPALSLIESHQGSEARSTYGRPCQA